MIIPWNSNTVEGEREREAKVKNVKGERESEERVKRWRGRERGKIEINWEREREREREVTLTGKLIHKELYMGTRERKTRVCVPTGRSYLQYEAIVKTMDNERQQVSTAGSLLRSYSIHVLLPITTRRQSSIPSAYGAMACGKCMLCTTSQSANI